MKLIPTPALTDNITITLSVTPSQLKLLVDFLGRQRIASCLSADEAETVFTSYRQLKVKQLST